MAIPQSKRTRLAIYAIWTFSIIVGVLLTCAFVVGLLVGRDVFMRGWDQLGESGYWRKKAIVFGIALCVAITISAVARFWKRSKKNA